MARIIDIEKIVLSGDGRYIVVDGDGVMHGPLGSAAAKCWAGIAETDFQKFLEVDNRDYQEIMGFEEIPVGVTDVGRSRDTGEPT